MNNPKIEIDLSEILSETNNKLDRINSDIVELKIG